MFHRGGDIVSDRQCVRTSRSQGNAYNLDQSPDVARVGLPRTRPAKAVGVVYGGYSSKCLDIGGELSVLQIPLILADKQSKGNEK